MSDPVGAKRRAGEDLFGQDGKRRKPPAKKPAFKPQPIAQPHSSDTPPEDELAMPILDLPPPPSERKPARRRPSMRAARPASPDSPSSPVPASAPSRSSGADAKRKERGRSHSRAPSAGPGPGANDPLRADLISNAPMASSLAASTSRPARIDFNSLASRGRPSMHASARPASPPRHIGGVSAARQSMGPPGEGFVRKTRKSMGAGMLPPTASVSGSGSASAEGAGVGMGLPTGVRATDVAVPLPESETPMIRKNKALREDQSRRSSLGMRGQRASTSLGRGELSIPHRSVDSADFYKHISSTLPEAYRTRHLLVYCNKRALDQAKEDAAKKEKDKAKGKSSKSRDKGKEVPHTPEGDRIVDEIMDAFLSGLGKGDVETNVFDVSGTGSKLSMLPHPKNKANREYTDKTEAIIRKSKEELSAWKSIKMAFTKHQKSTVEEVQRKAASLAAGVSQPDMAGAEPWVLQAVAFADGLIEEGEGELADKGEFGDVEFKVDLLNQATNSALQYSAQATRFLDGIFASLSRDLQLHPAGASASSSSSTGRDTDGPDLVSLLGTATAGSSAAAGSSSAMSSAADAAPHRPDPIDILRALASADVRSGSGNEDAVRKAGAVAPVSAADLAAAASASALRQSVGPGAGAGAGAGYGAGMATPRSAPTPRRAQALGQSTAGGTMTGGTGGLRGRTYGRGAGNPPAE